MGEKIWTHLIPPWLVLELCQLLGTPDGAFGGAPLMQMATQLKTTPVTNLWEQMGSSSLLVLIKMKDFGYSIRLHVGLSLWISKRVKRLKVYQPIDMLSLLMVLMSIKRLTSVPVKSWVTVMNAVRMSQKIASRDWRMTLKHLI